MSGTLSGTIRRGMKSFGISFMERAYLGAYRSILFSHSLYLFLFISFSLSLSFPAEGKGVIPPVNCGYLLSASVTAFCFYSGAFVARRECVSRKKYRIDIAYYPGSTCGSCIQYAGPPFSDMQRQLNSFATVRNNLARWEKRDAAIRSREKER